MLNKKLIVTIAAVVIAVVAIASVYAALSMQVDTNPKVTVTYNGENTVPTGMPSDFPMRPAGFSTPYYYCFNITVVNPQPYAGR